MMQNRQKTTFCLTPKYTKTKGLKLQSFAPPFRFGSTSAQSQLVLIFQE
jgi:hypothetical protein